MLSSEVSSSPVADYVSDDDDDGCGGSYRDDAVTITMQLGSNFGFVSVFSTCLVAEAIV